ncbi:phasin family protein [Ectothiorhodospira magna]|uniref:Phasin family protein n=1 Tax=Ectothiorhodospira magna TaxID=867345 RepID=A0A1H9BDP5_9GAMM|nr:TIGR01841 family phasin [Ectothiorhodospira magna]SEP86753.1 phasin family protein [Ectothiorhodospira magna]
MSQDKHPFDVSELTRLMDPQRYMDQMNELMRQFKMPNVDMSALMELQRKNVEAMVAANRTMMESSEALMKRQTEMLTQAMNEATEMARTMGSAKQDDLPARQVDMVGQVYDRMSSHTRETFESMRLAQEAALERLDQRFRELLEELKDMSLNQNQDKG